jgi:hypothetical protein
MITAVAKYSLHFQDHSVETSVSIITPVNQQSQYAFFELDESKMNFNFTAGFSNCGYHFESCPAQQLAAWCKYVET